MPEMKDNSWMSIVVASAAFWTVLNYMGPTISRSVASSRYDRLTDAQRRDWDTRVVGFVHAVVVSAGCLPIVLAPPASLVDNPLLGYSDESQFYIAIALGYFLWDIVISIACGWGPGFIVHAILCALAYLSCCWPEPFSQYAGCVFLLFELSTPFLHIRQFCILCQNTDSWLFKVANVMFPLTFLLVRLCMGIPFSYIWGQKLWVLLQTGNPSAVLAGKSYVLYGANFALNALNIYWFVVIVQKGLARSSRQSSTKGD